MYPPPTDGPPNFDHWEEYCAQPTFHDSSWPAMSDSEMTDSTPSPPFRMRDLLVDSDDSMDYDDAVDNPHFPDSSPDTFQLGGGFAGGYLDADSHNNGHVGRTSDEIQYRGVHEHGLGQGDVAAGSHYGMDPDQFLLEQRQLEHVLHRADPSTPANSALPPCAFHGPRVFPDPGDFLREKLHLPPGAPVDLWCVAEPADPATRPSAPYALLVTLAIYGTDKKRLTLQGLYREIANRFKYYRRQDALGIKSWRNSIRHALSLYALFINVPRPIPEPGKGEYWVLGDIHSDVLFTRLRKRNKKGAVTAKVEEDGDGSSRSDSSSDSRAPRKPRGRAERSAAPRKRRPTRAVSVDSDLNSECTSVCDSPSCMAESSATRVSTRIQYPSSTTVEGTGTKPSTKKGRRTRA